MRVCIDARLVSGDWGGVEQFVLGLAYGLSQIETADRFDFIAYEGASDWLKPYLKGPCRLVEIPLPRPLGGAAERLRSIRHLRWAWHHFSHLIPFSIRVPRSDGWLERQGYDVVHFTAQMSGFMTKVPSIYNPHDLQHLHLPEFFTPRSHRARELLYRTFCNQARVVMASSNWVKDDLIREYGLASNKIAVVPLAPPVDAYTERSTSAQEVHKRFSLPDSYIFYPAQTWPHKNHLFLLEAIAVLRDSYNLRIPLVCAGKTNDFFLTIRRRMRFLRLEDQVFFLGFVDPFELRVLYAGARCVVLPTRFEAGSFPLLEAFSLGVAAAASRVTSLPEQAGDAALMFSPDDLKEIVTCILKLWSDESLRRALVERGKTRINALTWKRAAMGYLEAYQRATGLDQKVVTRIGIGRHPK